jgi:dTDP-glucose 4,6-dehydratase/UDP-glucose 4-epimerase
MRYLVTGGDGFIGKSVVKSLIGMGHFVRILDNHFRSTSIFGNKKLIESMTGDIRDSTTVDSACHGIDAIVHLASINGTKYFYENPSLVAEVGILGMINLTQAAKKFGVKDFTLFSSSEVYQTPITIPTPENVPLVIPDIRNPRYSYGGAKIASELILTHMSEGVFDFRRTIRPHNVYGPGMNPDHVIPALIAKLKVENPELEIQGDGKQTRAFCYIEDFASAFNLVISEKSDYQIYNIGVDQETSILNLAKRLLEISGIKKIITTSASNEGETLRRCPDIALITSLGFKQQWTLEDGLRETWENSN